MGKVEEWKAYEACLHSSLLFDEGGLGIVSMKLELKTSRGTEGRLGLVSRALRIVSFR